MKKQLTKLALTAALGLAFIFTLTQEAAAEVEKPPEKVVVGTFTDIRDKKTYKTVKIGSQIWMAENLNYDLLSSKCYDNKPDNCQKYGRLYDWKTAMKACPSDWYLPSEADWSDLMQFVNPSCPFTGDCVDAGAKLKAVSGWNSDGNGTDNYGFAALPGGVGLSGGNFRDAGNGGLWWSSSDDAKKAPRLSMDIDGPNAHRNSSDKNLLFSIRCFQPAQTERGFFIDPRDKKRYKTVKIGRQTWIAENLNYEAKDSKCYGEGGQVASFDEKTNTQTYSTISNAEIRANCNKYGKLYNWKTAMKACPSGWHLPSDAEWDKLLHYVDGTKATESPFSYESKTAGKYLKAKSGWNSNGNGTDNYGFSALPGGYGNSDGSFNRADNDGFWWSSSGYEAGEHGVTFDVVFSRDIYSKYDSVICGEDGKSSLKSVRCIKD
jgi:Fibrobacter succinogenes major domain (Fib_succ_major).